MLTVLCSQRICSMTNYHFVSASECLSIPCPFGVSRHDAFYSMSILRQTTSCLLTAHLVSAFPVNNMCLSTHCLDSVRQITPFSFTVYSVSDIMGLSVDCQKHTPVYFHCPFNLSQHAHSYSVSKTSIQSQPTCSQLLSVQHVHSESTNKLISVSNMSIQSQPTCSHLFSVQHIHSVNQHAHIYSVSNTSIQSQPTCSFQCPTHPFRVNQHAHIYSVSNTSTQSQPTHSFLFSVQHVHSESANLLISVSNTSIQSQPSSHIHSESTKFTSIQCPTCPFRVNQHAHSYSVSNTSIQSQPTSSFQCPPCPFSQPTCSHLFSVQHVHSESTNMLTSTQYPTHPFKVNQHAHFSVQHIHSESTNMLTSIQCPTHPLRVNQHAHFYSVSNTSSQPTCSFSFSVHSVSAGILIFVQNQPPQSNFIQVSDNMILMMHCLCTPFRIH